MRWLFLFTALSLIAAGGCSDASLYGASGRSPHGPDRLALNGELCTQNTGGSEFPVKVLLLIDSSLEMFLADPNGARIDGPTGGIGSLVQRNLLQPHVSFGFVGLSAAARAYPTPDGQRFFTPRDPEVTSALIQLQIPLGTNRDVINAITQAGSFINKDIASKTPGEVLRSRYLVSMLFAGPPQIGNVNPSDPLAHLYDVDQTPDALGAAVRAIRDQVYAQGALEFHLNVGLLYLGPRTIDQGTAPYNCYPPGEATDPFCVCSGTTTTVRGAAPYCAVYCAWDAGQIDEQRNVNARTAYNAMAFAGDGRYREYPCPPSIDMGVGIASGDVELVGKDIVAFNRNVRLEQWGPAPDSDGDGLSDRDEEATTPPTQATTWDSDGDGLGDRIEFRTYPRQDPLDGTDRPNSCDDPAVFGAIPDRDVDLLNDCEEGLLQTTATIADSDGDGLPDLLEFLAGTIPTSADDRLLDFDGDGVSNADEVIEHTNPRTNDGPFRGTERYNNRILPVGSRNVPTMENPETLRGIAFRRASSGVKGGQSYLRWRPCSGTLAWSDVTFTPGAPGGGLPMHVPIDTQVPSSGTYRMVAESRDNGGQLLSQIWIELRVTLDFMPSCADLQGEPNQEVIVRPLISVSERNCYDVQISNIKLMPTLAADGQAAGHNDVYVFFTQAPAARLSSPGITTFAKIPVSYTCLDANDPLTCTREPSDGFVDLTDDLFFSATP